MPNLRFKQHWKLYSLAVTDCLLFSFINARSAPAAALIAGFVALVATLYYLFYGLLSVGKLYGLAFRHKRWLAAYLTAWTGFLLALQSIGELNSRDVLVLLPLIVVGYGYRLYGRPTPESSAK